MYLHTGITIKPYEVSYTYGGLEMKMLYLDCFSGISGDMMIGALLDAGGDFANLQQSLSILQLEDEYELKVNKVNKNGITCTKFDVNLLTESHHDDHHNRSYKHIVDLIKASNLSEQVQEMSLKLFEKIAKAESKIHGTDLEDIHFHEVGAVDSIIDIVGTAILIDQLQIDLILSAPVPTGSGQVNIAHGTYPVPAPATLDVLKGVPLAKSDLRTELTTPTGAAFAAVLASEYSNFPSMTITDIGYGAGEKTFPNHPNVLRVTIGKDSSYF